MARDRKHKCCTGHSGLAAIDFLGKYQLQRETTSRGNIHILKTSANDLRNSFVRSAARFEFNSYMPVVGLAQKSGTVDFNECDEPVLLVEFELW